MEKKPARVCDAIANDDVSIYPISIWENLYDIMPKVKSAYKKTHLVMIKFVSLNLATNTGTVIIKVKGNIKILWHSPQAAVNIFANKTALNNDVVIGVK